MKIAEITLEDLDQSKRLNNDSLLDTFEHILEFYNKYPSKENIMMYTAMRQEILKRMKNNQ
ncbi:hypothetical protein [Siminovitchia fordii]|uniref:Uncharacterized protein n=1 Tax=Siminovitchia fordii TaxID=254759 RepID=A0ABQ4KBU7_9BACI|nr:hypothetical protein [Siminovitchia fordii]GIN22608.1 hypothetical protein J1TS3_37420 [Siminovitchia fordii]